MKTYEAIGGLAYSDIPIRKYSAVVSNIPAKAGLAAHKMMLLEAKRFLEPDGMVWIVVVSQLEQDVDSILSSECVEDLRKVELKGHVVYSYRLNSIIAPQTDPYFKANSQICWREYDYTFKAYANLPEFDTLSYDTELLLDYIENQKLSQKCKKMALVNPTHGHLGMFMSKMNELPPNIILLSRDALSIYAAKRNILAVNPSANIKTCHCIDFAGGLTTNNVDAFIGRQIDDEGVEINAAKIAKACISNPRSVFITTYKTSKIRRLADQLKARKIKVTIGKKMKGYSLVECEKNISGQFVS